MSKSLNYVTSWKKELIWVGIIVLISIVAAVINNIVHGEEGIPWIAEHEYNIFVPCPEPQGEANPISYEAAKAMHTSKPIFIDSRSKEAYEQGHIIDAKWIPYDFLFPVEKEHVQALLTYRPTAIFVYGAMDRVHVGEELAKEISGNGLKNVYYITDGIDALQDHFVKE